MSILGYDPMKLYDGRGCFEALGSGCPMEPGDIAFKSNFAFMNLENRLVERRRVDRTFAEWGTEICEDINEIHIDGFPEHKIFCKHATEHRCTIKITGPRLSSQVTGTDPLKDGLPLRTCEATDESLPDAVFSSLVINAASETITRILLEN